MRVTAFMVALSLALLTTAALADVPGLISYQGTLTDADGVALDTTVSMTFSLYSDSTATFSVWAETQTAVEVNDGLFNVLLGRENPLSEAIFPGAPRWLGIQVGGDPELSPLQKLVSVPYAFHAAVAETADYALSAPMAGDGDWTISGNHLVSAVPGSVGIGTTPLWAKLDVAGEINTDSVYEIGGTTVLSSEGTNNIFVGAHAGESNTGSNGTFVGYSAGQNNQGYLNTFIGHAAGQTNTTGDYNTFVGRASGLSNSIGDRNTFIGHEAGRYNTQGYDNTFVGKSAGFNNATGHGNVFIGKDAGCNELGSNKLYIANDNDSSAVIIYGDFSTGRVGIGTTAPREKLEVKGDFRISGPASTEKKIKIGRYWDDTNYHTIQSFYDGANSGLLLTTYLNGSIILDPSGIGNVGIGTTTPGAKLHVYDSGSGNYGYVGSSLYGVYGENSSGNYGYIGSSSYCVLGAHTSGNWGYIGSSTYGVLGRLGLTTSPGNYAVFGIGASGDDDQGTGYDYPSSLGGVQGYNFYGNPYTFGLAGYSPLDSVRSGGCFGGKEDATVWGCYGYKNSAGSEYGGYATSWAPSSKAGASTGIGFGSWGELFGADIHGKVYGLYAEGGNYGLYSHGAIFLDDLNVHLQRMEDKTTSVLFTNVSTDVTVQTSGFSTLSKGAGFIEFDEDFRRVVSPDVPIVVTVTPTGNCNGVHVSQVTQDGFTVLENNAGKSDVTVAFIAIGRRVGYENPRLAEEVVSPDYVSKLSRGLHNDANTQTDGQGLYYENGELHVGVHPSTWSDVHKVRDEIAPPEEIQPELPSAIPDLKLQAEERETSGRTPKVNISGSKKR
jgi:hypothetical protein